MQIAVVTDSTSCLPAELVAEHHLTVVPLHVIIDGVGYSDGVDITRAEVIAALRAKARVSTSRPAPQAFLETYQHLASTHQGIISMHLSAGLSGTWAAARLGARSSPVPVKVVDSTSVGMVTGFLAVAAAEAAAQATDPLDDALERIGNELAERAAGSFAAFTPESLDYLRRGGRLGGTSAMLGAALSIKPVLGMSSGQVTALAKVRTMGKAVERMTQLAVRAAGAMRTPQLAVHHLDAPQRASQIAQALCEQLALPSEQVPIVGLDPVLGAHVGPGAAGVVALGSN